MKRIWIPALILLLCLTACKKAPATPAPVTTKPPIFQDMLGTGKPVGGAPIQLPGTEVPRSNQVGQLSISEKLEIVDHNGLTGMLIDPSATKNTTVVFFWETSSQESADALIWLDEIARENSVSVIAVHALSDSDPLPQFIEENHMASSIHFVVDIGQNEHGEYYTAMGGTGTYPYLAVLDQDGKNVQFFSGLPTREELSACITGI